MRLAWLLTACVIVNCIAPKGCVAFQQYSDLIPNGANVRRASTLWAAVGHSTAAGGGATNPFGTAFANAGRTWTAALCGADSDGDGFSNGVELGDPSCTWTSGATPARATGISHPGYADSTPVLTTAAPPTTTATTTTTVTAPPPTGTASTGPTTGGSPTATSPPMTTTQPATTSVSGGPIVGTAVTAPMLSQRSAAGFFGANWTILSGASASSAADDVLEITFVNPADRYSALGPSDDKMDGTVLIAYTPRTGTAPAFCLLTRTAGYKLGGAVLDGAGALVSATVVYTTFSAATGVATTTCRVSAAALGIRAGQRQRVIAATSRVEGGFVPAAHCCGDANRAAGFADFYAGTMSLGPVLTGRVACVVVIHLALLAWLATGGVLQYKRLLVNQRVNTAFAALSQLMILCMDAAYFAAAYSDLVEGGASAAAARAFGQVAALSVMFVFYPVPKVFGFSTVLGSSYERIASFHSFNACVTFVLMTCHFAAMAVQRLETSADTFSTNPGKYLNLPLLGFLAWLLMGVNIIAAFVLKYVKYDAFKLVHLLYVPIVVLVAIHTPLILITLAIPLLNLGFDLVARFVASKRFGAVVVSAAYSAGAEATLVRVQLGPSGPTPPAGCFGLFDFGLSLVAHPFSVAAFDETSRVATLTIKRCGGMTATLAAKAAANELVGATSWLSGWHGALAVPLDTPGVTHAVLIAGGVGVTPVLHIAQHLAADPSREFAFVWVVRSAELVDLLAAELAHVQKLAGSRMTTAMYITQTTSDVSSVPRSNVSASVNGEVRVGARPNLHDIIARLYAGQPVAVYTAGPGPMMEAVADAVAARPDAYLHCESYSI